LVIATGPGAASRQAVGTPVFYGMLTAAVIGVFVIPMLYVVFQWLREKIGLEAGAWCAERRGRGIAGSVICRITTPSARHGKMP
jgi:hypothetical protein